MTFDEWVRFGYEQGWVSPPVCETHDGLPLSEAEAEDDEPCIYIMRLYESAEHKAAVESEHAPSVWRATNQGWGVQEPSVSTNDGQADFTDKGENK